MALPIMATIEDIDDLVSYLKTKAAGATIDDAKKVIRKQILDSRKMPAYSAWGIIKRDGEYMKLDARGWHLARNTRPKQNIFQDVLKTNKVYYSALEWACHNSLQEVTNTDVGAHWHEHFAEELGTDNEQGIKDKVVCFFRVCEAANLGKLTIGRKGQTTRLTFNRDNLELFIGIGAPQQTMTAQGNEENVTESSKKPIIEDEQVPTADEKRSALDEDVEASQNIVKKEVKVFISHGKNMDLVGQVETMLGVAEIPYEIAISEETSAIPVPEKVFNSMRRCDAAIIIVSAENDQEDGTFQINQNVLIEIGAAFVLYNKKVILLWDKRLSVPSNLQGLYRSEFEGDELSWKAGMKLMKAIKDFRDK